MTMMMMTLEDWWRWRRRHTARGWTGSTTPTTSPKWTPTPWAATAAAAAGVDVTRASSVLLHTQTMVSFLLGEVCPSTGHHCQAHIKFPKFSRYFKLHRSSCTYHPQHYQNKWKPCHHVDGIMSLTVLFVFYRLSGTSTAFPVALRVGG